jgi:hypothetical protein
MRSYDDYRRILELWEQGFNKSEIEQMTGIPRATARDCIKRFGTLANLEVYRAENYEPELLKLLQSGTLSDKEAIYPAYAYLLGIYLGDGNISKLRNVYRLRVTLDAKYPQIIESCIQAISTLLPQNQVSLVKKHYNGDQLSCVDVSVCYKYLPAIFPQHGKGAKHTRSIVLEAWQQRIVTAFPLEFFRGLYHSDGSRASNIVNGKDYPRYQFSNNSQEICALFCETCDRLGIHWTSKTRRVQGLTETIDIMIAKRRDVAWLDEHVGAKC